MRDRFVTATSHLRLRPRVSTLAVIAVLAVAAGVFLAVVAGQPARLLPGRAALAYNAYTVSQTGKDEYGATMPLFFRSFGDYKSPAYTYLLAGDFRVAGPSIEAARALSAVLGLLAVLGLGLARGARSRARRGRSRSSSPARADALALRDQTRLVFEVALLPLRSCSSCSRCSGRTSGAWARTRPRSGCARRDRLHVPARPAARAVFALGLVLFFRSRAGRRQLTLTWGVALAASRRSASGAPPSGGARRSLQRHHLHQRMPRWQVPGQFLLACTTPGTSTRGGGPST